MNPGILQATITAFKQGCSRQSRHIFRRCIWIGYIMYGDILFSRSRDLGTSFTNQNIFEMLKYYNGMCQTPTRSVLCVRGSKSRVLSHSPISFYITTSRLVTLRTDWGQLRWRFPGCDTRGSFIMICGFFNRRHALPFWEQCNKFIVQSKSVYMCATVLRALTGCICIFRIVLALPAVYLESHWSP